jgi:hypothetical protein
MNQYSNNSVLKQPEKEDVFLETIQEPSRCPAAGGRLRSGFVESQLSGEFAQDEV